MNKMKLLGSLLAAATLAFTLSACEDSTTAEDIGESIDNATTDTRNAIEDACENVKDGVGADDTNC